MTQLRNAALKWGTAFAVWLMCLAPVSVVGETVELTLDEARAAAARALDIGESQAALVLAQGVMIGVPNDVTALILKSRALRNLARTEEAVGAGKAAWRHAKSDKEKFFAALAVAQAKASGGNEGQAQLWLRRAAQIAPDEELRQLAIRDFRHVKRLNPVRLTFGVSVQPSDNINGAPKTNTFTLNEILTFVNPNAVPLSGFRYGANVDVKYTAPLSNRSRVHFNIGGTRQRVELSQEARELVPSLTNNDFAVDSANIGAVWEYVGGQGEWQFQTGVNLSRNWVAHELRSDARSISFDLRRAFSGGVELGFGVTGELEKRHDLALRGAQTIEFRAHVQKAFASSNWLRFDISQSRTESESAAVAKETRKYHLSVGRQKPVLGMVPRLTLSYEDVDFAETLYGIDTRQDDTFGVSLNVLLPSFELFGFAPEIGVSHRDRASNFSFFESESTDWRIGIRSVF